MSYALFAQRKLLLTAELNSKQMQVSQRSDDQFKLATRSTNLQQQLTSMSSSQSGELSALYAELSEAAGTEDRDRVNAEIQQKELEYQREQDEINRQVYQISVKENAVELERKRLETEVNVIQNQLEAVEEAEGDGINRATPKFSGLG